MRFRHFPLRKPSIAVLLLCLAARPAAAHVGSPDVYYEGDAGPYHLFVTVRMPQVIPGVADIEVRGESGNMRSIEVVPMRLTGPGSKLPPAPDIAQASKDDPEFFTGSLWLMEPGALQVRITADGPKGKGELAVPVASYAQSTLPMERSLSGLLVFFMLLLTVGAISIVSSGVRDSDLAAGQSPGPANLRRSHIATAVTVVVVLGLLWVGRSWWRVEDRNSHQQISLYTPPKAQTTLEGRSKLVIQATDDDPRWARQVSMDRVIPDHNHLMHLFLISPDMGRMYHLHPDLSGGAFAQDLPAMPAGHYQVFADIVDERGFPWTLVGSANLPEITGKPMAGDDSAYSGPSLVVGAADRTVAKVPDGTLIEWERPNGPLRSGQAMEFTFEVKDENGEPVTDLQPYMGMAGHAEFVRSDFSVFAHVHPSGSVPMASLELAQQGLGGESGMPGMAMTGMTTVADPTAPIPPVVKFPYGFPRPGDYRIFVQVKRAGRVETTVFDTHVD
jgi:hypothetical protein